MITTIEDRKIVLASVAFSLLNFSVGVGIVLLFVL